MKNILLLLLIVTPLFTSAQKTFKFIVVNADTGQPMVRKWVTVLQDKYTHVRSTYTDSLGVLKFVANKYDSTTTYQAEITNHWNNYVVPGYFDVTSVKNSVPIIKIKPSNVTKPFACGTIMYPNYHAHTLFSLLELPEFIQAKVKNYLLARVGKNFYKKIVLNGGQLVDLESFYSRNPNIKPKDWQPPVYDICFMVWDSVVRESVYTFQLEMNSKGRLQKPVPLPDIVHHPAMAHILTLNQAKAIANTQGFDVPYVQTKLYYYAKTKSIVWEFEHHDDGEGEVKAYQLLIDAHNGKIVDKKTYNIMINH